MRNSNRSFSRSNNNNGGRQRGQRGQRQKFFDPTHVIAQSKMQKEEHVEEMYQAQNTFNNFQVSDGLKQNIAKKGFVTPTPIQDQIIPDIINGRDAVGIANTGTGKTAAFLIPSLNKILNDETEKVLIIVPTRELAIQVRNELFAFSEGMKVFSTLCIGGASIHRQISSLRSKPQFVIGTPGRIKDLSERNKIKFEQFRTIVLDEVDRMLDMGFVHDVRKIINALPSHRQSLFFSATMTDRVRDIMKGFLTNPIYVSVKKRETTANVTQEIVKIEDRTKIDVLHDILITEECVKVLVFGRTKRGAENLSKKLQKRGFRVNAIHGNKSQGQRQRALKQFRRNEVNILVATDVIARGLDIDDVSHVINYDLPESYDDYIHRIGRTGRANNVGTALTFI